MGSGEWGEESHFPFPSPHSLLPLCLFQQRLSLLRRESLDRISQGRSGNFVRFEIEFSLSGCMDVGCGFQLAFRLPGQLIR
jgi:hypothetical protein